MTNPVATWSVPLLWIVVMGLAVGALAVGRWIQVNDRPLAGTLKPRSAALEWIFSPSKARSVVESWEHANVGGVAMKGLLLDTFGFIPLYSTLLAVACFWAARGLGGSWTLLGWCGWLAGLLDLFENAGIYAELRYHRYGVAPVTATFAWMKWTLAGACGIFVLGRLLLLGQNRM